MTQPQPPEYSDTHHRKEMNHHLRAAVERALALSTEAKRLASLDRIIKEAQEAKADAAR